jgi:hypothetical protein
MLASMEQASKINQNLASAQAQAPAAEGQAQMPADMMAAA